MGCATTQRSEVETISAGRESERLGPWDIARGDREMRWDWEIVVG
jgi:hypothetical protein